MKRVNRSLLLLCLLLLRPMSTVAFVPFIQQSAWEEDAVNIRRGEARLPMGAWNEFIERYGSRWKIDWDESRGTPRAIYGSSIEVFPGGVLSGEFVPARLLSFVDENRDLFGISSGELQLVNVEKHARLWYANFQQIASSVPVYGGRVQFRLRNDGKLIAISARLHREIGTISSPLVSIESAERRAKREVFFVEGRDRAMETRLVVYPHADGGVTR